MGRPPDVLHPRERQQNPEDAQEKRNDIHRVRLEKCNIEINKAAQKLLKKSEPFPKTTSKAWNKAESIAYFTPITENGDFTSEARKERIKSLSPGVTVFRDVGLTFYKVQNGDTKDKIREKLIKIPEFAYVAQLPQDKLRSFNILDSTLQKQEGMWIPIPELVTERILSDEEFLNHAHNAIMDLLKHPIYGCHIAEMLDKAGEKEVLKLMLAIAKIESGGAPLGSLAFHRYEAHHEVFSYSLFHVLMSGPGLKARRKLNLSEGQLYHPENAAKLFLGFLIEKNLDMGKSPARFFPLLRDAKEKTLVKELLKKYPNESVKLWPEGLKAFCSFYNGKLWPRTNQRYPQVLMKRYLEAEEFLEKSELGKTRILTVKKMVGVEAGKYLEDAIASAEIASAGREILTLKERETLRNKVFGYLKGKYGNLKYFTTDSVGVGLDEKGAFLLFRRGKGGFIEFRL